MSYKYHTTGEQKTFKFRSTVRSITLFLYRTTSASMPIFPTTGRGASGRKCGMVMRSQLQHRLHHPPPGGRNFTRLVVHEIGYRFDTIYSIAKVKVPCQP